jgi:hypothetical protein
MSEVARRRLVVGCALLVALTAAVAIGGVAAAYWSGFATGTGSGTTGTPAVVTLSPATPTTALHPEEQADVVLTMSNPNPYVAIVGAIRLDQSQGSGGFAVDAGHAGCAVSALSYTRQTNGGAGWRVPARVGTTNGTLAVTLHNALAMSPDAANACQGASITVYLAAGP